MTTRGYLIAAKEILKIMSMIRKYHYHKLQSNPVTARKSYTTITKHQEDKLSKATSCLFPIKMIAKLERTQSNTQQNIEQLQNPTMGSTTNQQQQNHRLRSDSNLIHWGGGGGGGWGGCVNAFHWYQIFSLDSLVS